MSEDVQHNQASEQPGSPAPKPLRSRARLFFVRLLKLFLLILLLPLLLFGAVCLLSRTELAEQWITGKINTLLESSLAPSGLNAHLEALHSDIPFGLSLQGLALKDREGLWLEAEEASLALNWSALRERRLEVAEVSVKNSRLHRLPLLPPSAPAAEEKKEEGEALTPYNLFALFPQWLADLDPLFRINLLSLEHAALDPAVMGKELLLDVKADALLSAKKAEIQAEVRNSKDNITLDRAELALGLTADSDLALHLEADTLPEGAVAFFLPPEPVQRPALRLRLDGEAPLEDWRSQLSFALSEASPDEPNSFVSVASLEGEAAFSLPQKVNPAHNPWLPEAVELRLNAKNGEASAPLLHLIGLDAGKADLEFSARSSITEVDRGLAFNAQAEVRPRVEGMSWQDGRFRALFGTSLDADLKMRALATPDSIKVEVPALRFAAGIFKVAGLASFDLPPLTEEEKARETRPSLGSRILRAPLTLDLEAEAGADKTFFAALSPEAQQRFQMKGPARLKSNISGTALEPTARLVLSCPGIAINGESLNDVQFRARLDDLKDAVSTLSLTGELDSSLSYRNEKISLKTAFSLHGDRSRAWSASMKNLALQLGGLTASGHLSASAAPDAMPRLNGTLQTDITDWTLLSALSGMALQGEPFHAEVTLKHEGKQKISLNGALPSFALGAPEARQKDLTLKDLKVHVDASGIWTSPALEAAFDLKELDAAGMALHDIGAQVKGSMDTLINVTLNTGGDVVAALDAGWKPGKVELRQLEIQPGNLQHSRARTRRSERLKNALPPGLKLLEKGHISYSASTFSTSGLNFAFLPEGSLKLKGEYHPAKLNLDLAVQGFQFAPLRLLLDSLPDGSLDAELSLRGTLSRPSATLKASIKDLIYPGSRLFPLACDLNASISHNKGQSVAEARLEIPFTSLALIGAREGWASLRLPLEQKNGMLSPAFHRDMEAHLRWDGVLAPLWSYLPIANRRLNGGLHLAADLGGTLKKPDLDMDITLSNVTYEDIELGILLKKINAFARYSGQSHRQNKKGYQTAELKVNGEDGLGGSLHIDGGVDLEAGTVQANMTLDKLKPLRRQDLRISLSGDGFIMGTFAAPFVNANITVDSGELSLAHLPSSGITTLPISTGEEVVSKPPMGVLSVRINVPRRFFVRGMGLDSEWKGKLHIGGPLNSPGILGSIDVVRGNFDLLNKNFEFTKGSIQFPGSQKINPRLDIVMTHKTSDIIAQAIVGGSATAPKFRLASQPALPQDEIISQIMFGKFAQNLGKFEAIQLAGGVAALAGLGNGDLGVLGTTREALGVDMLRLNSSSRSADSNEHGDDDLSDVTLEMGKYINDRIYVGMEQGVKSNSTGALVEIELTPEISLKANTNSDRTEATLEWQHNY